MSKNHLKHVKPYVNELYPVYSADPTKYLRDFIEENEVGININPENLNNLDSVNEKLNSSDFIEKSINNVINLNKNEINKDKVIDKYLSLI